MGDGSASVVSRRQGDCARDRFTVGVTERIWHALLHSKLPKLGTMQFLCQVTRTCLYVFYNRIARQFLLRTLLRHQPTNESLNESLRIRTATQATQRRSPLVSRWSKQHCCRYSVQQTDVNQGDDGRTSFLGTQVAQRYHRRLGQMCG